VLLQRGYLNERQWNEKKRASAGSQQAPSQRQGADSVADELSKLAALKAQSVLSDEEFGRQKQKLLS
jgi:Short C-terminal domain